MAEELVQWRSEGLYCPAGDFYIDPARPVPRALITHAHGDHARRGSGRYWTATPGLGLLRERLGHAAVIEPLAYGERMQLGRTEVSLHPAGHVLGSAQVRIACAGEVWVVSGDYKRDDDPTCAPFEVLPCDVFVTEATFARPDYRWPPAASVAADILDWWRGCAADGRTAVLLCYALGKAQRILGELARLRGAIDAAGLEPTVLLHSAMTALVREYRAAGVCLLPTQPFGAPPKSESFAGRLVLAPPGASGTPWLQRFQPYTLGFASGWMQKPDPQRRLHYDRGFILSDHADWDSLLRTISETGARRVLAMHGHTETLVSELRRRGLQAQTLQTQ